MIVGPIFSRELVTAPRRPQFYISRTSYVTMLIHTHGNCLAGDDGRANHSQRGDFAGLVPFCSLG